MTAVVGCDISEFEPVVNDTYPHQWLTFRVCDGDYLDHNAAANLAWCNRAVASGKLLGFAGYVVYRPGENAAILGHLDQIKFPTSQVVMIDAETWSGQIGGDRSNELNALAGACSHRQGDNSRVWGYANRGDFGSLWPTRPSWLGLILASYGGTRPSMPNLVGWQYTDGQYAVTGLPNSSPPFGPCDHNAYFTLPQGDDMTPDECRAVVRSELTAALSFLSAGGNKTYGGATGLPAGGGVKLANYSDVAQAVAAAIPTSPAGQVDAAALAQSIATDLGPELAKSLGQALVAGAGA